MQSSNQVIATNKATPNAHWNVTFVGRGVGDSDRAEPRAGDRSQSVSALQRPWLPARVNGTSHRWYAVGWENPTAAEAGFRYDFRCRFFPTVFVESQSNAEWFCIVLMRFETAQVWRSNSVEFLLPTATTKLLLPRPSAIMFNCLYMYLLVFNSYDKLVLWHNPGEALWPCTTMLTG